MPADILPLEISNNRLHRHDKGITSSSVVRSGLHNATSTQQSFRARLQGFRTQLVQDRLPNRPGTTPLPESLSLSSHCELIPANTAVNGLRFSSMIDNYSVFPRTPKTSGHWCRHFNLQQVDGTSAWLLTPQLCLGHQSSANTFVNLDIHTTVNQASPRCW